MSGADSVLLANLGSLRNLRLYDSTQLDLSRNFETEHMQSCEWHDPETTMNEMELVLKKIADFEALWRTSERLTQRCSESSSVSVSPQTFTELASRIQQGDLEEAA